MNIPISTISTRLHHIIEELSMIGQQERQPRHIDANLLTVKEVAGRLRVDDDTVRRWAKKGIIECLRLPGGGYRFTRTAFDRMIN